MFHKHVLLMGILASGLFALPYGSEPAAGIARKPATHSSRAVSGIADHTATVPLDSLISGINSLNADLTELNKAFSSFSGRAEEALGLVTTSDTVYNHMQTIIDDLNARPAFSLGQAIKLATVFIEFLPNTQTAITGIGNKEASLSKLGVNPVVAQQLRRQKDQAHKLFTAIYTKLPAIGKPVASAMYKGVDATFDGVIGKFNVNGSGEFGTGQEASAEDIVG